jgi:uncharacterized protein (TIGR00299 family) protein
MKALYFDLIAGASGDMLLGGMISAGVSPDTLKKELGGLGLDEFQLAVNRVSKNGFQAINVDVVVGEQPPERHLSQILDLIDASQLPTGIKKRAAVIFQRIGEIEAGIHGKPVDQVHLHELGGTDTIVDVVGALLALDLLEISFVGSSAVPLGSGFIKGAHGEIPLPAPATLQLLEGIPIRGLDIQAELVTPTGAALLAELVDDFGPLPAMNLEAVGYGAGTRDLPIPNLLRVITGTLAAGQAPASRDLTVLESNLDDLNPEIYPYLMERLFEAGALDVTLSAIHMKKNRPGTQVQILCSPEGAAELRTILFRETTTLGVKQYPIQRYALPRETVAVQTSLGEIRLKVAAFPEGAVKVSPEYEDCRKLAREHGLPLREIYQIALKAYRESTGS